MEKKLVSTMERIFIDTIRTCSLCNRTGRCRYATHTNLWWWGYIPKTHFLNYREIENPSMPFKDFKFHYKNILSYYHHKLQWVQNFTMALKMNIKKSIYSHTVNCSVQIEFSSLKKDFQNQGSNYMVGIKCKLITKL